MAKASGTANSDWKQQLHQLLPLYGHRNWIVVADSAYPAQSRAGVDTIVSGASQFDVARWVFDAIAARKHVRANIYLDQELQFVAEADAPGVSHYRTQLAKLLTIAKTITLPHEQIITRLDQTAQFFRVLIIKTGLTIPYTSIFFELDCGYWSVEAEQRLRRAMAASAKKQ
ncbi:MAG: RbsD/FucU domain-containing protein [Terracidiphilus sp.]